MAKIRQEINILNATITATSVGFAVLTTGNYSGTVTYQFEIVGRVSGGTATVTCQRNGTTTNDATISLSATSYTRLRATLTPPAGATEYRVAISGGTGPQIRAARILVFQDSGSNPITATETQIEIGGQETQTSATNIPLTAPKYWYYDSSKWDTISWLVEIVGKRDTSNMSTSTWVLQEDNGSLSSWTDKATIASAITTTTAADYRVAFNPINGRNYRIVSRDSNTLNGGHVTYSAKIIGVSKDLWQQTGNGLSISSFANPALAGMSSTRVAYFDTTNDQLRAYDFNGTSWSQVGNSLTISGAGEAALAAMSSTRVAFIDDANQQLRAYDFDGTNWSQVGNSFAVSGVSRPALAKMTQFVVALADVGNDIIRLCEFSGTDWFDYCYYSLTPSSGLGLAGLSTAQVALVDSSANTLVALETDYTDWYFVSGALSIPSLGQPAIAALSSTRVAVIGGTQDELRTYDFSGGAFMNLGTWSSSGGLSIATVGNPALATLSSTRVAFIDDSNDSLRAYDIGAPVTKLEAQYLLINQNTTSTGLQDQDTLFDPAEWSGVTNAYFHETNADGASSAVKLQTDPNGTPADISSSTVTGANRQRTAALTMPTSSATIDANVTTA